MRLIYSEEELDFLEGEFAKNQLLDIEAPRRFGRRLGVDEKR